MSTTNFVDKIKVNTGSGSYEADLQVSASNITDPNQNRNLRTLLSIDTPLFNNGETLASLLNSLGKDIQNNKRTLSKLLNLSAYKGTDGADGKSAYLYYAYSLNQDGLNFVSSFNELNLTDDNNIYYFGVASSDDSNIQNIQEKFSTDDFTWIGIRRGLQGQKGDKGDTGSGLRIRGSYTNEDEWTNISSSLLPGGENALNDLRSGDAFLVGPYEDEQGNPLARKFYVATGIESNLTWIDQGYLTSAPGEQGPQGIQGIKGEQGTQGIQGTKIFIYKKVLYTNEIEILKTFESNQVEEQDFRVNDYLLDLDGYLFKITNIDTYKCSYTGSCLRGPQGNLNTGTFLTEWTESAPEVAEITDANGKTIYVEKSTYSNNPTQKEYYSFVIPYNNNLKAIGQTGGFETISTTASYNNAISENATLYFTSILGSKNDLSLGSTPPQIRYAIINGDSNVIYGAPGKDSEDIQQKDENIHIFGHSNYLGWDGSSETNNEVRRENLFNNINIFGSNNKFYNNSRDAEGATHSNYYIFGNNNIIDTNYSNESPKYIFGEFAKITADDIFIIGKGVSEAATANLLTINKNSFNFNDLLIVNNNNFNFNNLFNIKNNQFLFGFNELQANDIKNYFEPENSTDKTLIEDIVFAIGTPKENNSTDILMAMRKDGAIRYKQDSSITSQFINSLTLTNTPLKILYKTNSDTEPETELREYWNNALSGAVIYSKNYSYNYPDLMLSEGSDGMFLSTNTGGLILDCDAGSDPDPNVKLTLSAYDGIDLSSCRNKTIKGVQSIMNSENVPFVPSQFDFYKISHYNEANGGQYWNYILFINDPSDNLEWHWDDYTDTSDKRGRNTVINTAKLGQAGIIIGKGYSHGDKGADIWIASKKTATNIDETSFKKDQLNGYEILITITKGTRSGVIKLDPNDTTSWSSDQQHTLSKTYNNIKYTYYFNRNKNHLLKGGNGGNNAEILYTIYYRKKQA